MADLAALVVPAAKAASSLLAVFCAGLVFGFYPRPGGLLTAAAVRTFAAAVLWCLSPALLFSTFGRTLTPAALRDAGTGIDRVSVIGGGARSRLWGRILASALDRPLAYVAGGEVGPAFGAARLARLAADGGDPSLVCTAPPIDHVIEPEPELVERYARRLPLFRALYRDLRPHFREI